MKQNACENLRVEISDVKKLKLIDWYLMFEKFMNKSGLKMAFSYHALRIIRQ